MIYLQKSRPSRRKSFYISALIVVLVIAAVFCIKVFAGGFIDRMAMSTGGPVASTYLGVKDKLAFFTDFIHSHAALVEENQKLQAQIDNEQAQTIRFDSLLKEHEDLLAAYGRSTTTPNSVLANVISKPPQSPYDVLISDAGIKEGISLGGRVYGLGGIPIGRVSEVTNSDSKIVMFSSVGEENDVIVERTSAAIHVTGIGGGNMEARVPQDTDITAGDKILLPQFNAEVVGFVVDVESSVTSAFKRVLFRSPISIFDLRWVEILRTPR